MGNILSSSRAARGIIWPNMENANDTTMSEENIVRNSDSSDCVGSDNNDSDTNKIESDNDNTVTSETRKLSPLKEKELEEFRKNLAEKREARKKIIKEKSDEMNALREQLDKEKTLSEDLIKENNKLKQLLAENNIDPDLNVTDQETSHRGADNQLQLAVEEMENHVEQLRDQLKQIRTELCECNLSLQNANSELALINKENTELRKQIVALKDVNRVSKEMMNIRELQITQLKEKLTLIEETLEDREMRTMSTELKEEYERQLQNIRNLRILYEERSRLAETTRLSLVRDLELKTSENENLVQRNNDLEARNKELEEQISAKVDIINSQESQLGFCKADIRGLQAEMTVINQLFSQMLMGYNSTQDLDKLLVRLEENHDLLKDVVVRGEGAEGAAALPRMLLDLLNQLDDKALGEDAIEKEDNLSAIENEGTAASSKSTTASAQEIVGNLPKVWRVLMELLSHQSASSLSVSEISEKSSNSCYKSVETPSGPRLVPSVSKTYIRLKDLILEKKSLQKETNRLKQLNSHLENRLQDQERRLGLVSSELSKTWRIVGKMQRQHQQLHTHEKILRYELQQKRKMLTELKEQLEFCKEKWDKAKEKNSQSQIEWDKLRLEFSNRKLASVESINNNSAESGYSDEKPSDTSDSSDDENEDVSERRRLKRKTKSPESNVGVNPTIKFLKAEENDDSDIVQDEEESPLEGADILSDGDSQANLADTEDQSISESAPVDDNNTGLSDLPVSCFKDVLQVGAEKLKKLEKKCCVLATKVVKANNEGVDLCTKLEQLQNQYGGGGINTASTSKEHSDHTSIENNEELIKSHSAVKDLTECQCETQNTAQVEQLTNQSDIVDSANLTNQASSSNKYILEYEARFAARDARLNRMEEQTKSLVKKMANTSTRSVAINFKLDELHNVYGRSEEETASGATNEDIDVEKDNDCSKITNETNVELSQESNLDKECFETENSTVDFEAKYALREEMLKKIEEQAMSIVEKVTNSTNVTHLDCELNEFQSPENAEEQNILQEGEDVITILENSETFADNEEITEDISTELDKLEEIINTGDEKVEEELCEPTCSTSTTMNSSDIIAGYEARFAAREERLRRMEEQAKSLVEQVSNTTTRGVKIGFKLDELHNVYGISEDQTTEEDDEQIKTTENVEEKPNQDDETKPESEE